MATISYGSCCIDKTLAVIWCTLGFFTVPVSYLRCIAQKKLSARHGVLVSFVSRIALRAPCKPALAVSVPQL